jgi:hypothetical protein
MTERGPEVSNDRFLLAVRAAARGPTAVCLFHPTP